MARPTSYNQEILELTKEYQSDWKTLFPDDVIPTIEGLSLHINIARSTIYDWISQEDNEEIKEFSDIVSKILANQGKTLVNKGLTSEFNSSITKAILSKHGYREGTEVTGLGGKDLIPESISQEDKEKLLGLLK